MSNRQQLGWRNGGDVEYSIDKRREGLPLSNIRRIEVCPKAVEEKHEALGTLGIMDDKRTEESEV